MEGLRLEGSSDDPLILPNYEMLGYLSLFCISFSCFAIFTAKVTQSVLVQIAVVVVGAVLYMMVFHMREIRFHMIKASKAFNLLVAPGYVIPVGGFGFLWSRDQESNKEAYLTLSIQLAVFFLSILLIESLSYRFFRNFISFSVKSRWNETLPENSNPLAIRVCEVFHRYFSVDFSLLVSTKPKNPFKRIKALQGMNLNVREAQCYALLGVNGAGKSTMFEILTGGNRLQRGFVSLFTKPLATNPLGVLKDVGYCSQMDKAPSYLQARSVVELFGKLRGLSDDELRKQVDMMVQILDVTKHMRKLLGSCSGGTKRKVSTMVAFVGFPRLIILDESTTG